MRRHKRRQLHVQWSPGTIAKRHKAALCACKSTVSWQAEHQKSKFLNYHIYKYYIIYITIGLHDCTFQWPTTASGSRPLLLPRKNRRPRVPIIPEEVAISSFAKLIGSLSLKTAEFNKMILQFFSTNNTGYYIKRCAKLVGAELKREKNRTPCFAGLLPLFRHNLEMNALQAKKQREKNLSYLFTEKLNPI